MNSRRNLILVGVALLAVVVGLFIVLSPDDSKAPSTADRSDVVPSDATDGAGQPPNDAVPKPEQPKVPTIVVRNGEPVGGPLEIDVEQGDRIRFKVKSDIEEEVHVHGFDVSEPVGPGQNASFDLAADFTGIFEAELELSGVQIAELQVNP